MKSCSILLQRHIGESGSHLANLSNVITHEHCQNICSAAVCENILTLMWRILAAGPIQASSAALQLAAPQVRRWPSLYRLQNAMLELSTWS